MSTTTAVGKVLAKHYSIHSDRSGADTETLAVDVEVPARAGRAIYRALHEGDAALQRYHAVNAGDYLAVTGPIDLTAPTDTTRAIPSKRQPDAYLVRTDNFNIVELDQPAPLREPPALSV